MRNTNSRASSSAARVVTAALCAMALASCGDDFPTQDEGDVFAADSGEDGSGGATDVSSGDAIDAAGGCTSNADCSGAVGPCQVNVCLPTGACVVQAKANGTACDSGDACLSGEQCQQGLCQPGWNVCPCQKAGDDDFKDCESSYGDGDPCNGTLYCEPGGDAPGCRVNPSTVVTCTGGTSCAPETCDATSGACVASPAPNGTACSDGDPCTKDDTCVQGSCAGGANQCPCTTSADCKSQEDGDLCNGTLYCDNTSFPPSCKVNPATVVTCLPTAATCTERTCAPKTGQCVVVPLPAGTTCTDGQVCTQGDACAEGACKPGKPVCPCQSDADCAAKDDGDVCNGTLFCDTSSAPYVCKVNPKSVVTCDTSLDGACEETTCAAGTGKCVVAPKPAGTVCTDGDSCTLGDACKDGACVSGGNQCACKVDSDCAAFEDGDLCNGQLYCDKSAAKFVCKVAPSTVVVCNPSQDTACVKQTCGPQTGVCTAVALPEGATCDADGNPCTPQDACTKGLCAADKTNTCECVKDSDCAAYDDGNACNGALYCDTTEQGKFRCRVNPATVVHCSASGDSACSVNACDPKSGACAPTPVINGAQCNADNNACTEGDACQDGVCTVGVKVCACTSDADCKLLGADPCAGELYCDTAAGAFTCAVKAGTQTTCKLEAGKDPQCAAASCVSAQGKAVCETTFAPTGTPCSDGKDWTLGDACTSSGTCVGKAALACTTTADCLALESDGDLCNGGLRCLATGPKGSPKVCTAVTTPLTCTGSGPCDDLGCEPKLGLCLPGLATSTFGKPCDDGDACTTKSACVGGSCAWAQALTDCDDANMCTKDACTAKTGCSHTGVKGPCTDGDPCTLNDACKGDTCTAGTSNLCPDGDPCTADTCDAQTGKCSHAPKPSCTPCKNDPECDDANPCTKDVCDLSTGCTATLLQAGSCSDNDPCTSQDACVGGACKGATTVCDDNNPCTTDTCKPGVGCAFTKKTGGSCSDGDACTTGDTCTKGSCLGMPKDCDDSNPCTSDACDGGACLSTAVTATTNCTDGNPCTTGDTCVGKACKGTAKSCDDGKSCTKDSCDSSTGQCAHVTDPSACQGGVCTKATCDSAGGCVYKPQNDGKTCSSTGATCGNGSCGPCEWWSAGHGATGSSTDSGFESVVITSTGAITLGGVDHGPPTGTDRLWLRRVSKLGATVANVVSKSYLNSSVVGLAQGKDAGTALCVSEPTRPSTSASFAVRFNGTSVNAADVVTYKATLPGGLKAITRLSEKHRWGIAAMVPAVGKAFHTVLIKVDHNGKEKQRVTVDATGTRFATGITEMSTKKYVMSAHYAQGPHVHGSLIAFDDSGKQLWTSTASGFGIQPFTGVATASADQVVGCGGFYGMGAPRAQLRAVKAKDGKTLWSWWSDVVPGASEVMLEDVAATGTGSVVAVGRESSSLADAGLMVHVSAQGKLLWRRKLAYLDSAQLVSVDVVGDVIAAAGTTASGKTLTGWVVRMKLDGTQHCAK